MKINLINKLYITLVVVLVLASIFNIVRYKRWDTYYYFSSVSVPSSFPVYIRDAYFLLPNDDYAHISTEDSERFMTNWGDEHYFAEANDNQRLPEKLVLKYVSYRDQKFYADTIDVPQQAVQNIFEQAAQNRQLAEIYSNNGNRLGLRFVIGVANKGNIIVWLRGKNFENEVLKAQIKSHLSKGDDTYYLKRLSPQAYFEHAFENLSDSVKLQLKNGFEAEANYIDTPSRYLERLKMNN